MGLTSSRPLYFFFYQKDIIASNILKPIHWIYKHVQYMHVDKHNVDWSVFRFEFQ